MIRVVIIDDEILARIGIQTFLENKQYIQVTGTFCSALDALEHLQRVQTADIVITDIEMPDMNGLEFIGKLRGGNLCTGIIIVSCHDNFIYAREALELGADSYILKQEVSEERLLETVNRINADKIVPGLAQSVNHNQAMPDIEGNTAKLRFAVGVLKLTGGNAKQEFPMEEVDRTMLIHLLENIVDKEQMGTLFSPCNKELFLLFQFDSCKSDEENRQRLKYCCEDLIRNVTLYINEKLVIGCSRFFDLLTEVKAAYEEGLLLTELSFYESDQCVFYSGIGMQEPLPAFNTETEQFQDGNWMTEFNGNLDEFLRECSMLMIPVDSLKQIIYGSLNHMLYRLAKHFCMTDQAALDWGQKLEGIWKADRISCMRKGIMENVEKLRESLLEKTSEDSMEKIMENVIRYLQEHIHETVSLTEAASLGYMSVPYFCRKFKEYTGETYVTYVNARKVDCIKTYLDSGGYTLSQIADRMNFQNTNYLIRLFKSVTGLTVREYKRKGNGKLTDT